MRQSFAQSMTDILGEDTRHVLLLGDIGVFGFSKAASNFPGRVLNIGILEQSMVGVGAGLALSGHIPTMHTIAPFVVERAFEQIKIDFGYQDLPGNIVSVGGSVDYAALGCTHHCPGDISLLSTIPGIQILTPGTGHEFSSLLRQTASNDSLTYIRISESSNAISSETTFGRGSLIKTGTRACIVCFGPTRDATMAAAAGLDVSVLYFTSVQPFDFEIVAQNVSSGKILLVEPWYQYSVVGNIIQALPGRPLEILSVGFAKKFRTKYGKASEHLCDAGLDTIGIRKAIVDLIDA